MAHKPQVTNYIGDVAGINGIEITGPMKTDLNNRLNAQEGKTYPQTTGDFANATNAGKVNGRYLLLAGGIWTPTFYPSKVIDVSAMHGAGDRENPIAAGIIGDMRMRFAGTIIGFTLMHDVAGTISINLRKGTYTQYPFSASHNVATFGTTSAIKAQGSLNIPFAMHDIIQFNVASTNNLIKQTAIELHIQRVEPIGVR